MGRTLVTAAALLAMSFASTSAAEIKVLSPGAMMSSLKVLTPQFEQASSHKVSLTYSPALALAERIKNDEVADVVILGEGPAAALEKQGKLVAGSRTIVGRVGVGVFVRRGDPKPDISTVAAFNRALINAKAITYSDPALGGSAANYVNGMIEQLDVTGSIRPKITRATRYRSLADFVAGGGADFGLNQIAEIVADPRLELVGPLPGPLQRYTHYTAAVVAAGGNHAAAKALIGFLASPVAVEVMKVRGFEPL